MAFMAFFPALAKARLHGAIFGVFICVQFMKKTRTTSAKTRSVQPKASKAAISTPVQAAQVEVQAPEAGSPPSAPPIEASEQRDVKPSVSFELVQPQAREVYVAGTFNEWRPETTPLQRTPAGRWVGELTLTPGKHEYLFVVDGQWVPDPRANETVRNPFGGENSVLSVTA
jgi:hypothetical protein